MIDWDKRTITGMSGTVYKIAPEDIPAGRWSQYELQSASLGMVMSIKKMAGYFTKIYNLATTGNEVVKQIHQIAQESKEALELIKGYEGQPIPKVVEFLSIMCVKDGEELHTYKESMVREKFNDWSHIPMKDFFLLAAQLMPSFKENYLNKMGKSEPA